VTDTGVGIAPEILEHVFEPFFTTKGDRGGTGLGLSICHSLVAQQGGDIAIESVVGRGTTVIVRMRPAGSSTSAAVAPTSEQPPASTSRRILLVDDEVRITRVLREGLVGHEVTVATSGREALAHLEGSRAFDVIVCDLMMPDMSGMEVHDHVRALRPGLEHRIVFITGGTFTPNATEFLARVANPCLEKPFRIHELAEVIERTAAM
jgi:CheY-like chemotaxis protein